MSFWIPAWAGDIPRLTGQPSAAAQMPDAAKPGPVLPVVSSVAAAPVKRGRPAGSKNKAKR